jgi:acyl carrier protein
MVMSIIFEKLRNIVAVQFSISESSIDMDTSFIDDLGADSLDVVELTMAIEEAFDVPEVDDDTVAGLVTFGDVFRFISDNCD